MGEPKDQRRRMAGEQTGGQRAEGQVKRKTVGQINRRTDGQTHRHIHRHTYRQSDNRFVRKIELKTLYSLYGQNKIKQLLHEILHFLYLQDIPNVQVQRIYTIFLNKKIHNNESINNQRSLNFVAKSHILSYFFKYISTFHFHVSRVFHILNISVDHLILCIL